ncbi:hypothetical protein SEA_EVEPICKLES_93 [Arthrobacter phage EvePickles]|nr:hypothetical protein SEA_EVEPICKLES_93 [Arthrobacter phage EvePickles]
MRRVNARHAPSSEGRPGRNSEPPAKDHPARRNTLYRPVPRHAFERAGNLMAGTKPGTDHTSG